MESGTFLVEDNLNEVRNRSCGNFKLHGLVKKVDGVSTHCFTDDVNRNLNVNALTQNKGDHVDVLDDLSYGVLGCALDQHGLCATFDVKLNNCVLVTKHKCNLVRVDGYVNRVCAVTIDHSWCVAGRAKLARCALAECMANSSRHLDCF